MAVDRSFTVAGAGTVVTGVVMSGKVATGETVAALPAGVQGRVRGIHALGKASETGLAGQRVALNIAGVDRQAVARGHWLLSPEQQSASARFDAKFRLLDSEPRVLRTWAPIHLHVGTSAIEARIVLLEGETLAPGQSGLVQIVSTSPLPIRAGDRFVARDAGGERTIGGGAIVDPAAPQRFRRTLARLAALAAMAEPDAAVALDALLDLPPGIIDLTSFAIGRGLAVAEIDDLTEEVEPAVAESQGHRYAARANVLDNFAAQLADRLAQFHATSPERPGMAEDSLRLAIATRLTRPQMKALLALLAPRGEIVAQGGLVRLASHSSSLGAADQRLWERLEAAIGADHRYRPPQVRELAEVTGQPITTIRKLLKTMARLGAVVEVASDRFFLKPALLELGQMAGELAEGNAGKTFTAAEFRDRAGSGRSVGIQILEHFDRRGLTLRQGDVRRVVKDPAIVFGERASR
jgi:selenocysteine-specific elongation factor